MLYWIAATPLWSQDLNLATQEDFLKIVEPIITLQERQIYEKLPDARARGYFQEIFWYKRDKDPGTTSNRFKRNFFLRRQESKLQFGEGSVEGTHSDRGTIFLLLGEPDKVIQNVLPETGLQKGYEEVWQYSGREERFRFVTDGRDPRLRLDGKEEMEGLFERVRRAYVLDRAEPYILKPIPLTLPNLGFTKDIENLASRDQKQINFELTYAFFEGNLNQTEVMVGLTFKDASDRGVIIHLAAYDPFENKVRDFKKRLSPVNGRLEMFSLSIEPDQYNMVLRLEDGDGRESIDRTFIDVPRIGAAGTTSSLLLGPGLDQVPLQGFLHPKKFVFEDVYFPITNDFRGFSGDRLYLMQHFYRFENEPQIRFFMNHVEVAARVERKVVDTDVTRIVVSIPVGGIRSGTHWLKSVFEDESGNLVVTPVSWNLEEVEDPSSRLLARAMSAPGLKMIHPSGSQAAELDRVVVRADEGIIIRHMYVYLNGNLILEREKAPWEVFVDQGLYSISGQNTLTVVAETDQGLLKVEKKLVPLVADEKIKTRLAQIFFNAFDKKLNFVVDLDVSTLSVEVDGVQFEPKEVVKLEEPITYCFLVDTSYSMHDSFSGNISALKKFIESMRPRDNGYFIEFSNNYTQYLHPNASKAVLLAVVGNLNITRPSPKAGDRLYEENETFLYDAVISAIQTLLQYSGRKVIVLVSDGIGIEGHYSRNGMLSYAQENNVVIYSLWIDNNPRLSDEEEAFLRLEKTRAEKVLRAIGLSRFFAKKDARKNLMGNKIRQASIADGMVKILAEDSGGFHYRIFRADRSLIKDYVEDIERALQTQYMLSLYLPISAKKHHVDIFSSDPEISIRCKSEVKVPKANPLVQ